MFVSCSHGNIECEYNYYPESDDTTKFIDIPFVFPFFCKNFTSIGVSSNGLITLGIKPSSYVDTGIPNSILPNNYIYVYWSDMITGRETFFYQQYSNNVMIQWNNMKFYSTFQVELYSNGSIQIVLTGSNAVIGRTCTVELEDEMGLHGMRMSFKTNTPQSKIMFSNDIHTCENYTYVYRNHTNELSKSVIIPDRPISTTPYITSSPFVNFTWEGSDIVVYYKLLLSKSNSFDNLIINEDNIEHPFFTFRFPNISNDIYFWKVYACNTFDCIESCLFTIQVKDTPLPPSIPDTPLPPSIPDTPLPPSIPDTPLPPSIPDTPLPPSIPDTPLPPSIPDTPLPPSIPDTPLPPSIPDTPLPPSIPDTPLPPSIPDTPLHLLVLNDNTQDFQEVSTDIITVSVSTSIAAATSISLATCISLTSAIGGASSLGIVSTINTLGLISTAQLINVKSRMQIGGIPPGMESLSSSMKWLLLDINIVDNGNKRRVLLESINDSSSQWQKARDVVIMTAIIFCPITIIHYIIYKYAHKKHVNIYGPAGFPQLEFVILAFLIIPYTSVAGRLFSYGSYANILVGLCFIIIIPLSLLCLSFHVIYTEILKNKKAMFVIQQEPPYKNYLSVKTWFFPEVVGVWKARKIEQYAIFFAKTRGILNKQNLYDVVWDVEQRKYCARDIIEYRDKYEYLRLFSVPVTYIKIIFITLILESFPSSSNGSFVQMIILICSSSLYVMYQYCIFPYNSVKLQWLEILKSLCDVGTYISGLILLTLRTYEKDSEKVVTSIDNSLLAFQLIPVLFNTISQLHTLYEIVAWYVKVKRVDKVRKHFFMCRYAKRWLYKHQLKNKELD